ncbi:hypothetical protein NDU88_009605 [Pleurodeles waltl]|uniref:Uncharacterized protein n=1 Tax=Pleurodeles waltl TaxID=8319 RepID=A0AAV7PSY6_PLEWA|nr:hypothetical protein NDU88_009605 [Pleurodeles waltl]
MGSMQYVLGVALVDGRQWPLGGHLALWVRGSAASSPGRAYRGPGLPRQLPRHGHNPEDTWREALTKHRRRAVRGGAIEGSRNTERRATIGSLARNNSTQSAATHPTKCWGSMRLLWGTAAAKRQWQLSPRYRPGAEQRDQGRAEAGPSDWVSRTGGWTRCAPWKRMEPLYVALYERGLGWVGGGSHPVAWEKGRPGSLCPRAKKSVLLDSGPPYIKSLPVRRPPPAAASLVLFSPAGHPGLAIRLVSLRFIL